jgi:hypothetical protein
MKSYNPIRIKLGPTTNEPLEETRSLKQMPVFGGYLVWSVTITGFGPYLISKNQTDFWNQVWNWNKDLGLFENWNWTQIEMRTFQEVELDPLIFQGPELDPRFLKRKPFLFRTKG